MPRPARLLSLAVVCFGLTLAGCGDGGTGESGPSMAGDWVGGAISNGVFLSLDLTLTDDGGDLIGEGIISVPGLDCPFSASGSRNGDQFNLSVGCQGFQAWTYKGTARTSTLTGRFNGSGFSNFNFDMGRQTP